MTSHKHRQLKEQRVGIVIAGVVLAFAFTASSFGAYPRSSYVLAFTADDCAQCQLDKRLYPKVLSRYPRFQVLDYYRHPDAVKAYKVRVLPTYILVTPSGQTKYLYDITDLL